jgi:hypothetical protein
MRGGVTVNDLLHTYSWEDRESIYKIITDNIELSKVTGQPFL